MGILLYLVLCCIPQQEAPSTVTEVSKLIEKITPAPVGNVGRGMAHRVREKRMGVDRLRAIRRLQSLGVRASSAVPILTQLISDPFEPQSFKLAEVNILREIGPLAISSLRSLERLSNSDDLLLATAAELAILHIDPRPEDADLKNTYGALYPLLQGLVDQQYPSDSR